MVKNKKAQLTLFIVLGIAILLLFGMLFYVSSKGLTTTNQKSEDFETYMDLCLKQYAEYTIYKLGFNAGNMINGKKFEQDQFTKINYASYNGEKYILSIEDIETQLENEFNQGIQQCADSFPNKNYEIKIENPETSVTIAEEDVYFNVKPDIKVYNNNKITEYKYNKANIKIKASVKEAYETMNNIVDLYNLKNQIEIHNYLSEKHFEVRILSYNDNTKVFYLIDKTNLIAGQPYLFRFAIL